jgi:hypothetical protein
MAINYIGDGSPDGTVIGRTDGKLGFYGLTTPVALQTITSVGTTTATTTLNETRIQRLETALGALNLVTFS